MKLTMFLRRRYNMQHISLHFQRREQVLPSNIYFVIRFKNKLNT